MSRYQRIQTWLISIAWFIASSLSSVAGGCLSNKCGKCPLTMLIYCGLVGSDLHGPTISILSIRGAGERIHTTPSAPVKECLFGTSAIQLIFIYSKFFLPCAWDISGSNVTISHYFSPNILMTANMHETKVVKYELYIFLLRDIN